jgi:DNA-binding CsgD family transcriptional regulator
MVSQYHDYAYTPDAWKHRPRTRYSPPLELVPDQAATLGEDPKPDRQSYIARCGVEVWTFDDDYFVAKATDNPLLDTDDGLYVVTITGKQAQCSCRAHTDQRVCPHVVAVNEGLRALAFQWPMLPSSRAPARLRGAAGTLTRREREVLSLIAQGLSNPAIGERLIISVDTVRDHVGSLMRKLGVHSRLRAAVLATEQGLLDGLSLC